MSAVKQAGNDVFVSYAHVDDLADPGCSDGWVTTLIRKLMNRLSQLLGREDAFRLWMDHELIQHAKITPEILGQLDRSETILVILSPGYLSSYWCRWEGETFLKKLRDRFDDSSRVFIVERDMVDRESMPREFLDYGRYQFWEQDKLRRSVRILGLGDPNADPLYNDRLDALARQLARKLLELKEASPPAPGTTPPDGPVQPVPADDATTVFVAEVPEELYSEREVVVNYLEQRRARVIPDLRLSSYPTHDAEALRAAVRKDMAGAKLFVQLLGSNPSRRPPGIEGGYVGCQHQLAVEHGLPILQWRSPELTDAVIGRRLDDTAHRALLTGPEVRCVELNTFCGEIAQGIKQIQERERKREEAPQSPGEGSLVFVNYYHAEQHDREVANAMCEHLKRRGLEVVTVPPHPTDEGELRKDMQFWLVDNPCKAAIIVHGRTSEFWVRRQLGEMRKMAMKLPLAVYQAPPPPKGDLGLLLRNMKLIDCVDGFDEVRLEEFIAALSQEVAR
jgi:hypothetical protein